MPGYESLDIYKDAFQLAIDIRALTLKLSNVDKFEVGSQIRRSSQSIKDNIVEGYGRKKYKAEFIRFLIISYASLLESKSQAEFLYKVTDKNDWKYIKERLEMLGGKIHQFIKYAEKKWNYE